MGNAGTTRVSPQPCLNSRGFVGSNFAIMALLIRLGVWYLCVRERARTERGCREIAKRSSSVCYCTALASWKTRSEMSCILFFTLSTIIITWKRNMAKWISVTTKYLWKNAAGTPSLRLCSRLTNNPFGEGFNVPVSVNEVLFFPLLLVTWYGSALREEGNFSQVLCLFFSWVV